MRLTDAHLLSRITEFESGGSLEIDKEIEVKVEDEEEEVGVDVTLSEVTSQDLSDSLSLLDDCYSLLQGMNENLESSSRLNFITPYQKREIHRLMGEVGTFILDYDLRDHFMKEVEEGEEEERWQEDAYDRAPTLTTQEITALKASLNQGSPDFTSSDFTSTPSFKDVGA